MAGQKQAIEDIIVASWRAGYETGRSTSFRSAISPIIEWDGLVPKITGFKLD